MHLADGVSTGDGHWMIDHLLTHNTVKRLLDTTEQTSLRGGRGAVIVYCVTYLHSVGIIVAMLLDTCLYSCIMHTAAMSDFTQRL